MAAWSSVHDRNSGPGSIPRAAYAGFACGLKYLAQCSITLAALPTLSHQLDVLHQGAGFGSIVHQKSISIEGQGYDVSQGFSTVLTTASYLYRAGKRASALAARVPEIYTLRNPAKLACQYTRW